MTMLSYPSFILSCDSFSLVLLFSLLRPLSSVSHFLLILVFNFYFTLPFPLLILSTINLTKAQLFHEIVTKILILAGTAIGHFLFKGKGIFHLIQLSIM
jgi:hypothetical protein